MRAAAFQLGIPLMLLALLALGLVWLVAVYWRASSAERRARLLLRDLLTDTEFQQLTNDGYLELASPSARQRVYRIPSAGGRVGVYEWERLICELCLRPTRSLPASDLLVLHMLMIEGDEADCLATANHFAPVRDRRDYPPIFWYW